jgi:hypothetical protein
MPDNADFYDRLPVFEGFANIMDRRATGRFG